jgi:hypothetical protein
MTELIKLEDLEGLSQEEIAAKIAQANEEYKNLKSNTERWAQQILEEKKLAEKSLKALADINGDNAKLVELYDNDPKLGDYLLKSVFNGASIDEFREGGTQAKPTEDFDTQYQKKRLEERIEEISSKLSPELKEKFDTEFKELTEGKKLTKENQEKYIKIALKEVSPDYTKEELEAKIHSTGWTIAKPKESWPKTDESTVSFLKDMGIVRHKE